ncbi:feruloyl esterase-like protein [Laetiporus sulphureus 93-53]|uniref:Carboxylic ester hydrolase n=1 Tax=Laetiporus sulphureus 93-53 TaxID=1314785 RepID=A0A165ERK8_9APHY|nr:feruloyl esterase-like protein [Laetiporus sulphureus 93-53]KZT07620.1 feruloyl esterase-like protein [Laetiporus sulphureus 93-53]
MFGPYVASLVHLVLRLSSIFHPDSFSESRQSACASFALQDVPDVKVSDVKYYPAHAKINISNTNSHLDVDDLPAFCRLEVEITTNATAQSKCKTEIWLPDDWNGRYLAVGNGGLAGGVMVSELGYVAIAQGSNAIIDWGWRALHLSVVKGKDIIKQYYGQAQSKSYFMGCSTGACIPLKEVQTFPEDFDGVIVGSPANWHTHLQAWAVHMHLDVQPASSPTFINASLWTDVIHPEVLKQCDAIDGLADGITNDPRFCNFRPETLTCRPGQNTSTCLTLPQIEALRRVYADYYEANQTYIFGRYYPGGEDRYPSAYMNADAFALSRDWFRYFVLNNTEWNIDQYNPSLISLADEIDPGQANAINPNLTAFAGPEHNGKLLHYMGWADQLISPGNSIYYYENVLAYTRANTDMDVDDFYRLFTVPGMDHCAGGNGANAFGAVYQASDRMPPISNIPQYNILAAMVNWVEEGSAPSSLEAVHYEGNNVANGVTLRRPLCQYPKSLRYIDDGKKPGFACV